MKRAKDVQRELSRQCSDGQSIRTLLHRPAQMLYRAARDQVHDAGIFEFLWSLSTVIGHAQPGDCRRLRVPCVVVDAWRDVVALAERCTALTNGPKRTRPANPLWCLRAAFKAEVPVEEPRTQTWALSIVLVCGTGYFGRVYLDIVSRTKPLVG